MAFLRIDKRRVSSSKANKRATLEQERDAWIAKRQAAMRSPSVELLGRTFATKRKAAEFAKRCFDGDWHNGEAREARSFKARGKASMATKRVSQGAASDVVRVRPINGGHESAIWRRYVGQSDQWRWVSDHASQDDALAARNPLNEPE